MVDVRDLACHRLLLGAPLVVLLAVVVAVAGCSALVSTSGLVGGGSATAEGGVDGASADVATVSDDAAPEASTVDGAAGTFCVGGPKVFCDDFEGAPLAARWTELDTDNIPDLALDTTIASSPTHSLLAKLTKNSSLACGNTRAIHDIAGAFGVTRSAFSIFLTGSDQLAQEIVFTQSIHADGNSCQTLLRLDWTGAEYEVDVLDQVTTNNEVVDTSGLVDTTVRIQVGQWHRVDLESDFSQGRITVRDESGAVIFTRAMTLSCPHAPASSGVALGFHCVGPSQATKNLAVRFDDVVHDAR